MNPHIEPLIDSLKSIIYDIDPTLIIAQQYPKEHELKSVKVEHKGKFHIARIMLYTDDDKKQTITQEVVGKNATHIIKTTEYTSTASYEYRKQMNALVQAIHSKLKIFGGYIIPNSIVKPFDEEYSYHNANFYKWE